MIGGLVLEEEIKFPVSIFRGICHQYGRHYLENIHNKIFELSVKKNTCRNLAPNQYNNTDRNGVSKFMHFVVYAHFSCFLYC